MKGGKAIIRQKLDGTSDGRKKASDIQGEEKKCEMFGVFFTNEELTEELKAGVAMGRGLAHVSVHFVQSQHSFLYVALGLHPVPLVVVEGHWGAHAQLHRPVAHVKREGDHVRSCVREKK